MLPKSLLVNLLYRYKLVKQAALRNYIKEAYIKQLQYRDQIQQLIGLHRSNSLVKKASLLNDLYQKFLLEKAAGKGRGEPMRSFQELQDYFRKLYPEGVPDAQTPGTQAASSNVPASSVQNPGTQAASSNVPASSVQTSGTSSASPDPDTTNASDKKTLSKDKTKLNNRKTNENTQHGTSRRSTPKIDMERLRNLRGTQQAGGWLKGLRSRRPGLVGGTIGAIAAALPSLYVGSRMGRSSAYERGKMDALSNLTEEKLRTILEQNKADTLKNLTGDQLKALLEQIKKQSIQA